MKLATTQTLNVFPTCIMPLNKRSLPQTSGQWLANACAQSPRLQELRCVPQIADPFDHHLNSRMHLVQGVLVQQHGLAAASLGMQVQCCA